MPKNNRKWAQQPLESIKKVCLYFANNLPFVKDQTDQIILAADRLENKSASFRALNNAFSYCRPRLRGGLSTAVRAFFRVPLLYHPPDFCQSSMPPPSLSITDFELSAVSPLQLGP
ncbi:hypothetical protein BHYA_0094g00050 [Botrytis hyacinthi]|uniref:Uncharacterized protein n=1 Tax=Botrytis hyacinthi TaxID=278943 RepID=A0A4Z1GVN7_9HELO|nr:hypothetical protein BHYA_0094g00050 [Botrytis hyacinthi]